MDPRALGPPDTAVAGALFGLSSDMRIAKDTESEISVPGNGGDKVKVVGYLVRVLFESIVLGVILALCIYFVFSFLEG